MEKEEQSNRDKIKKTNNNTDKKEVNSSHEGYGKSKEKNNKKVRENEASEDIEVVDEREKKIVQEKMEDFQRKVQEISDKKRKRKISDEIEERMDSNRQNRPKDIEEEDEAEFELSKKAKDSSSIDIKYRIKRKYKKSYGEPYSKLLSEEKFVLSIINNYPWGFHTDRIERMEEMIERRSDKYRAKIMHYQDLDYDILCKSKGIILTGSSNNVSHFDFNMELALGYQPILSLIRGMKQKPILGVCFGFHLAGAAFDAEVKRMRIPSPGNQIINFEISETDELIPYKDITANVFHRDFIVPQDQRVRKYFKVIATHEYHGYKTIQYMRHKERPLYAVQFHPETHDISYLYDSKYDIADVQKARLIGEEIVFNFLEICEQYNTLRTQETERIRAK